MTDTLTQEQLEAVKERQQATWNSGDYAVIGTTLQIVGESLCEAVDLSAGQKVLDVAAGSHCASSWSPWPTATTATPTVR